MASSVLHDMPKVELHAHLGGSIRPSTINELMREKGLEGLSTSYGQPNMEGATIAAMEKAETRMQHCFKMFDAIYKVTDNLAAIHRISKEVVLDYSAENTKYLELRTSLKNLEGKGTEAYLDTVLHAIDEANASLPEDKRVDTKLLVSVNRSSPVQSCKEAVATAIKYKSKGVVGMDLSGNCYKGVFSELSPYLVEARNNGLPMTLHVGEKDDEVELKEMLELRPDRIGHLVFSKEENEKLVRDYNIPIEMCITSNLITTDWKPDDHHVTDWVGSHPISLNTDDRGVFDITLTSEFELFQKITNYSDKDVFGVAKGALSVCFLPRKHGMAETSHEAIFEILVVFVWVLGCGNSHRVRVVGSLHDIKR